ncbi:MAG TPA: hypothetical protein QGF58_21860 [Myxococcota bacterium]|nr:hypothetical protein [Myxococcota bacterium]
MIIALTALGCVGSTGESGLDSSAECGSTEGFVYGTVTRGSSPAAAATVKAYPGGEEEGSIRTQTNTDGQYELNLTGGVDWVITSWDNSDCYSDDQTVSVVECVEEEIDFDLDECISADKPNLYLYPDEPTKMSVRLRLDPKQNVIASEPAYEDGWAGVAWPDGTWTQGGERFDFLFYEVGLTPSQHASLRTKRGMCAQDLSQITDIVREYGFDEREVSDFHEAWVEDLPDADLYAVYPQRHVARLAGLQLDPPLRVERLWLVIEPAESCDLAPMDIHPVDRSGAHAVEWGVVLDGF